jgi:hypothetical protein
LKLFQEWEKRIKENDGNFANVTMYPQCNNNKNKI